jgi:integrase
MGKRPSKPKYRPYNVGEYRLNWYIDQFAACWEESGARRRFRLGVTTEDDARSALHRFARQQQKLIVEDGDTLRHLAKAYIADRREEGKQADRMQFVWNVLDSTFGPLRAPDVTRQICKAYIEMRRGLGRAEHTIHGELRMLRSILNWSARNRLIPAAPHIWMPPRPGPRDRHLTRIEVEKLLEGAASPYVRLFIILAIATAARMQAILGLSWKRVDFKRGLIDLRDPALPKTNKGRAIVPMNDSARTALIEAQAGALSEFVIEYGGKRVGNIKRGIATALKRAGIKIAQDGAHLLRHSAAVWMAEDGVPMSEIAQYLGHSSTAITERVYARYSPDYLRKAAGSLNLPSTRAALR